MRITYVCRYTAETVKFNDVLICILQLLSLFFEILRNKSYYALFAEMFQR